LKLCNSAAGTHFKGPTVLDDSFFAMANWPVILQILYASFTFILILLAISQLFLGWYYKHQSGARYKAPGIFHTAYHWCSLGASLLVSIKAIDPIGFNGILTPVTLYPFVDNCTNFLVLASFLTIFEICCICYYQLDAYTYSDYRTKRSNVPQYSAYILTILWIFLTLSTTSIDILLMVFLKNHRWRGIVFLCYAFTYLLIAIMLLWIRINLSKTLQRVVPELFEANTEIPTLKTRQPLLDPSFKGDTSFNLESPSHYRDLQILALKDKYTRFKVSQLIIQLIAMIAFTCRMIRAYQVFHSDESSFPVSGEYSLYDDLRSWLQVLLLFYLAYYAWIPFPLIKCCKGYSCGILPDTMFQDADSANSDEDDGDMLENDGYLQVQNHPVRINL